jgi:hypothetical protein
LKLEFLPDILVLIVEFDALGVLLAVEPSNDMQLIIIFEHLKI